MAVLHGKNSYLFCERHAVIPNTFLKVLRTRRNISVDVAFYASCSPEQLSFEIREFYKDSFDKICNELLVDIRSEIDQIYESYNLGVSGRIASARKRRVEQIYFYIQFAFF